MDRHSSLWKIPTRLRGTNFCTSSAHFALSFVRQLQGPKCIQIVQHTPKHEFRSHQGQSCVFVVKNYYATSWHELLHQCGPFCTKFCKATNRFQIHPNSTIQNTPKHVFRVQWIGSGAIIAKNSATTSWHELLHHFDSFCTKFCRATKRSQMHPNSTKRTKT